MKNKITQKKFNEENSNKLIKPPDAISHCQCHKGKIIIGT